MSKASGRTKINGMAPTNSKFPINTNFGGNSSPGSLSSKLNNLILTPPRSTPSPSKGTDPIMSSHSEDSSAKSRFGESSSTGETNGLNGDTNASRLTDRAIKTPLSRKQKEFKRHMAYLPDSVAASKDEMTIGVREEILMSPLFSASALEAHAAYFPQYALLAGKMPGESDAESGENALGKNTANLLDLTADEDSASPDVNPAENSWGESQDRESSDQIDDDPRVFLNVTTPWSAFICGSQGSGKSHTLSCILENCLLTDGLGKVKNPLAGIVFHWDRYTSFGNGSVCEAAYLCSAGIPVRVLVSPTNFYRMQQKYNNMPGLPRDAPKPIVIPMMFKDSQLDVQKIMDMMAVTDREGPMPLYVEVVLRILRELALDNKANKGFNYPAFLKRLQLEEFNSMQAGPLKLRLDILESFMQNARPGAPPPSKHLPPDFANSKNGQAKRSAWFAEQARVSTAHKLHTMGMTNHSAEAWDFPEGTLTIVDLSCPFVDAPMACTLFGIALDLFLASRSDEQSGRIVALDEAHKFLTGSSSAQIFTGRLSEVVRLQRHLGARVVIATQEPTLGSELLDLATMTIVHRFTSPAWMHVLREHLAGASVAKDEQGVNRKRDVERIFKQIVNLNAGDALLFSPAALLDTLGQDDGHQKPIKLGSKYLKIHVRKRLTADGGRSVMAI